MGGVALGAAVAALAAYVLAAIWLAVQRSAGEPDWTRAVYVVAGVEALAFSAAGWLWGTQVGRGAVEMAERRAADAMGLLAERDGVVRDQQAAAVEAAAGRAVAEATMAGAMRAVEAFSHGMATGAEGERLRLLLRALQEGITPAGSPPRTPR